MTQYLKLLKHSTWSIYHSFLMQALDISTSLVFFPQADYRERYNFILGKEMRLAVAWDHAHVLRIMKHTIYVYWQSNSLTCFSKICKHIIKLSKKSQLGCLNGLLLLSIHSDGYELSGHMPSYLLFILLISLSTFIVYISLPLLQLYIWCISFSFTAISYSDIHIDLVALLLVLEPKSHKPAKTLTSY